MENRTPSTRQPFQPSRTRLLQPSQIFRPSPSPSPSQSQSHQPDMQHSSSPQIPPSSQIHTKPVSRIPRFPSNFPRPAATPFLSNTSQNPSNFTPFLSKSAPKPPSFPLRSANQPFLQPAKHNPILISKNQPTRQSTNRASPSSPSSPPIPNLPNKPSSQPVALSSSKLQSAESTNSQQPHDRPKKPSSSPNPPHLSVQQPFLPDPLSTLPAHVLNSMSQDKRDGFIAGWSACLDAYRHWNKTTNRSTHKQTSPTQNSSQTIQQQCSTSSRPSTVRLVPSVVPRKVSSSGTASNTPRRVLPDPYATEQPDKRRPTVASNKRPLSSPPSSSNPHPSHHPIPVLNASHPRPPATQILNSRSTTAPPPQPTPSAHGQNPNTNARKRISGQDAFLARGKLPAMSAANAAFAAATTSNPVEYQRKKRKRNTNAAPPDLRPPPDTSTRQETTSPVETRTLQETRRPVDTRVPVKPRPVDIRPRPHALPASSMNLATNNARTPAWLSNIRSAGNGHMQKPIPSLQTDPRHNQKAPTVSETAHPTTKRAHPNTAKTSIPLPQNGVGQGKQILPHPATENGLRCDLDMVRSSQESQEESGWGSALNAATARERLSTRETNKTDSGKQPGVPGNAAQKPREPATGTQRDPLREKQTHSKKEAEANSVANRLAEKERDNITVEAYAERFGLVIVERDRESGKVEWVACKFCPVFGCRTRDPDYIMAHRAPFSSKKFISHLEKDHCVKWKEYKQANAEEKGQFFSGKVLPAKAFHDRVAELKRSQDGMARRRVTPAITAAEEDAQIDRALVNLAKQQIVEKVTTVVVDNTDDCWIGRERFRDRTANRSISVCQMQASIERPNKLPPIERISKCIKELEIDSDIAGLILHGIVKDSTQEEWDDNDRGFTDTIVLEGEELRPTTLIFSNVNEATASRVALTLQYLYQGMAGSTCVALLQDIPHVPRRKPHKNEEGREVLGHGNALMALAMYILTRALAANWRNWAVSLTTRPCRYVRGGAVEVLISMYNDSNELRKAHLITVQDRSGAGAAVVEVLEVILPSWRRRLLGVHSGICKQTQTHEKQIEDAILGDVRKLTGREVMLVGHEVSRDDKPCFPWALSKMCESKFDELISSIECPLGLALGKARLRAAKAQRGELFKRVINVGGEREAFRAAWNVAGERAPEICVVAEGLQSIWLCDCEMDRREVTEGQTRGQNVVDCDAERVLWARELFQLWTWCGKVVKELGMETP